MFLCSSVVMEETECNNELFWALVYVLIQAGKLARTDFCRQFRLVVGEQLLRSAIPEMRGSEQGFS